MANVDISICYPTEKDLRFFIYLITTKRYKIKKYLPPIDDEWYRIVIECINYVKHTSFYEENLSIYEISSKILYKVTKRHELGDGNKRSGVMSVYIFCILNDYYIEFPQDLKEQAKRIASTKGRRNENLIRKRVAESLQKIIIYKP